MTLRELGKTQGFTVTGDSTDIRGWRALDDAGGAVGRVVELIFDPDQNVVHYAVVGLEDDRRVLWPVSRLGFHDVERAVVLKGLDPQMVDLLREYEGEDSLQAQRPPAEPRPGEPIRMQLHEERLDVSKRKVKTGEMNITKRPRTETVSQDVTVYDEDVQVTRQLVNRPATGNERIVTEGDVTRVPVIEERLVVEKRPFVVEEIVITKKRTPRTEHIEEQVRREDVFLNERPIDGGESEAGRP